MRVMIFFPCGGRELLPQRRRERRLPPVRSAAGAGSGTGTFHPRKSWQGLSWAVWGPEMLQQGSHFTKGKPQEAVGVGKTESSRQRNVSGEASSSRQAHLKEAVEKLTGSSE